MCRHVFRWLQAHGCPAAVSGSLHRQQLVAGLRYLGLCTAAAAAAAAAAAPATATPSAACTRACTGEAPGGCCCGSCSRGGTTSNGYAWAGGGAPGPCPCPCRSPQAALAVELLAEVPDLVRRGVGGNWFGRGGEREADWRGYMDLGLLGRGW